jgi:hypothetical protein
MVDAVIARRDDEAISFPTVIARRDDEAISFLAVIARRDDEAISFPTVIARRDDEAISFLAVNDEYSTCEYFMGFRVVGVASSFLLAMTDGVRGCWGCFVVFRNDRWGVRGCWGCFVVPPRNDRWGSGLLGLLRRSSSQ